MIKILKSPDHPEILTRKGPAETADNKQLYDNDPSAYQTGEKKFTFKPSIYGHKNVKERLIADQSGKCCFCEADFTANGFGDIEHFRPKGGYRQRKNDRIARPGYYWKAYDWDNLFFSCEVCNSRYKKNYFPLEDETQRAKNHHDDIDKEHPLLVHPSRDEPESHIGFRREVCRPKDKKGEKSIAAYGLNRDTLIENRREYLNKVKHNLIFSKMDTDTKTSIREQFNFTEEEMNDLIETARRFINKAARSDSPFAAMVRHNFPDLPK